MQAPEYRDNKVHTGWLDSRIAMRVRVERPPWHISVVSGALHVSHGPFLFPSIRPNSALAPGQCI